ncbi:hypothetical protein IHQ71_21300 [Rhizobium sp. TH2]|uniref:hypothetical protein n=1 Tax=Rhizobium sp. TH2 TaxID=2775403 RepID=UPI002158293D|nr:hypothetical protein [Rhizobium sp. TH2]UVC07706.1 hypothetical protein IHQ71_21300 [Rhizobium sp. TH2]
MTQDWQRKYRWRRTCPDETDIDGKPFEDYCAFDDDINAGRIGLERESLKTDHWRWSGSPPPQFRGTPIMPNAGYSPTAADAAKAVEDYWVA